jgi:BirA family transcriptional regulator, biotin operon repressor / biotin---[acetyl-CoA-carboxylase] ligase
MPISQIALLRSLDHRAPHSAHALAGILGSSVGEVRSGVASMRALGVEILAVSGKGYKLGAPFAALDAAGLRLRLQAGQPKVDLVVFDEIDSTNAFLLREAAANGASPMSGRACIAEIQTAGRGRRGRTWFAAPGASLAFSMLWRFDERPDFLAGLSLAAGIAVVRVLRDLGADEVRLKWPNDVVHRHRKLAGILVETQGGGGATSAAVVGIGINLQLPHDVRSRIDQAVTDVGAILPALPERTELAALLLHQLACVLDQFSRQGFRGLRDEWASMHAYQGQAVRMHCADNRNVTGRVTGVAADGALLVDTDTGEQRFYSGEISLRPA